MPQRIASLKTVAEAHAVVSILSDSSITGTIMTDPPDTLTTGNRTYYIEVSDSDKEEAVRALTGSSCRSCLRIIDVPQSAPGKTSDG